MGLFDWLPGVGGTGASASGADRGDPESLDPDPDGLEGPVAEVAGGGPKGFRREAEDLAGYWSEHDLDYRPPSLARLDSLTERQRARSDYVRTETHAGEQVAFRPAAAGSACYFGEVLVRAHGGSWTEVDGSWVVVLEGSSGQTLVDVFAVAHDCLDGDGSFVDAADTALRAAGLCD
ncbi:MAG: hypothetical protein ABEJ43_00830 [Haloferacaceae archaeon]